MISREDHLRLHGYEQSKQIQYHSTPTTIVSIEKVGIRDTYDIQCKDPYNNFIANRFVVHNSGKTCIVQLIMRNLIDSFDGVVLLCNIPPRMVGEAIAILKQVEPNKKIICLFEDIDAIIRKHGEADILALLDGESQINNILNIATTNYPELLDKRIVSRPRRFDRRIKVAMPSAGVRKQFLVKKLEMHRSKEELDAWVTLTEGFSFAALTELVVLVECLGNTPEVAIKSIKELTNSGVSSDQYTTSKMGFNKK